MRDSCMPNTVRRQLVWWVTDCKAIWLQGLHDNRPHSFCVYAPSRTVAIYAKSETCDAHADELPTGVPGLGVKGRGPKHQI